MKRTGHWSVRGQTYADSHDADPTRLILDVMNILDEILLHVYYHGQTNQMLGCDLQKNEPIVNDSQTENELLSALEPGYTCSSTSVR